MVNLLTKLLKQTMSEEYNSNKRYTTVPKIPYVREYYFRHWNFESYLHDVAYIKKRGFWLYHDFKLFKAMIQQGVKRGNIFSRIRHVFMAILTLMFLTIFSWIYWFSVFE